MPVMYFFSTQSCILFFPPIFPVDLSAYLHQSENDKFTLIPIHLSYKFRSSLRARFKETTISGIAMLPVVPYCTSTTQHAMNESLTPLTIFKAATSTAYARSNNVPDTL